MNGWDHIAVQIQKEWHRFLNKMLNVLTHPLHPPQKDLSQNQVIQTKTTIKMIVTKTKKINYQTIISWKATKGKTNLMKIKGIFMVKKSILFKSIGSNSNVCRWPENYQWKNRIWIIRKGSKKKMEYSFIIPLQKMKLVTKKGNLSSRNLIPFISNRRS